MTVAESGGRKRDPSAPPACARRIRRSRDAVAAIDCSDGAIVGVARYGVWPGPDRVAELATAVVDDWQGRGIGRALTARIIERARADGMIRLTASAFAVNRPALALLRELGFRPDMRTGSPSWSSSSFHARCSHREGTEGTEAARDTSRARPLAVLLTLVRPRVRSGSGCSGAGPRTSPSSGRASSEAPSGASSMPYSSGSALSCRLLLGRSRGVRPRGRGATEVRGSLPPRPRRISIE
jgi:GNAT superfamily N-acetyltransferase